MRFNHNDFKNKLKNNPKIQNDFKTIKARYENEILNAHKKETFFNKLVNFFKSSAFKASFLTSSFVVIILIIVGSLLLPNLINKNEDDPIITTPPIFTGISLKEESTKITSTSKVNNVETLNLNDETFKTVDELIDTSLSLPKDNNYYVDFNEDIILDVAFYNPFKFEIISFEIISSNDNQAFKFTNYMFLNGSNLEHIYVNPEKMGNQIVTYKIDNIKYIDGTEIKICPKEGNDTLTVYPRYYFNPIVNKLRSNIYLNEVKFDYQINDISSSLFNPKLYVSNGYELIYEEEITNYNFVHLELNNLKLIRMDALNIDNIFKKEIDTIYLNFSDPWPKDRHAKRRLTSPIFLKKYDNIFKSNNHIIMKTDNIDLFNYSLETLKDYGYKINYQTNDLHKENDKDNIMTEYEKKFTKLGIKINKLDATK